MQMYEKSMMNLQLDQTLTKKIKIDQKGLAVSKRSPTFAEKTMEQKKWMKTEQMLEVLKNDPNNEQQYAHNLGGILRSTHWLEYNSEKNLFGDSTDWNNYAWYSEAEFLELYAGHWWMREH